VSDAVEALIRAAELGNETVHIGSDTETQIGELYKMMLDIMEHHPSLIEVPSAPGSVRRRCPDISKLRRLTGFSPRVGLEEGVRKTCAWYLQDLARRGPWE